MLLGCGEDVQSRSVSGISPSLDIELFPESAKVLRLVIDNWEHPAKKEKVARLYRLDISTKRRRVKCLPSAGVRTAVHVQHVPGDMTSFRQINHRLSDVLRIRNRPHR